MKYFRIEMHFCYVFLYQEKSGLEWTVKIGSLNITAAKKNAINIIQIHQANPFLRQLLENVAKMTSKEKSRRK